MGFGFLVLDEEEERYEKWKEEHDKVCTQMDIGAIGGRTTWSFTQTGLGCIKIAKCACGEELDLTNWENW